MSEPVSVFDLKDIPEGTVLRMLGLGGVEDPVDVVVGKVEPAEGGGVYITPRVN